MASGDDVSKFSAIPTMYSGVQFRSRLEAKWAAFFDIVGWQWEYEPFDLGGWIPDFYVWPWAANTTGGFLIEIKPAFSLSDFDVDRYESRVNACDLEGYEGIVLLGARIFPWSFGWKGCVPNEELLGCQLGWFINALDDSMIGPNYWSMMPREYRYRPDAINPLFLFSVAEHHEGEACWAEAGNRVQWRGHR